MLNDSTTFLGLDLGDKHSHLTMLDQHGDLIEETRLPTSEASFRRKFSDLPSARIAMEVGTHSRWASHLLKELGHEVLVANARKLRAIYDNPRKTDHADAETLARLVRMDPKLLSPIHHRSPEAQADLAVLRSRDALVRSRTLLINHVRGRVKSSGARLPSCSTDSFSKKVLASIPEPLLPAVLPILDTIGSLTQQIRSYDRQIETLCESQYPDTRSLQQVPGVGALTALAFVLTLEDPTRFAKSREVGPAIGLVPRRDQSGDRDPQLPITKTGNAFLRRLLVGSAHYILGPFGPDSLCPARVRPAPLGLAVGRAGRQEREEEGCCGGRSKAGSAASPTMEDWRNLCATLLVRSTNQPDGGDPHRRVIPF